MKKIFILFALLVVAMGVSAQQNFEKDYTYGFWSNWSVGGSVMYTKTIDNNWKFGQGSNIGFDIRATKQLGQHWNMRIIGEIPGLLTSDTNNFDRYAKAMVGFAWKPANHFYVFADGGIAAKAYSYGWLALAADAGIGVEYDVCKHSTIFGELGMDVVADFKNDLATDNAFAKIGWKYNFGITDIDKMILEQRHQLAEYKAIESTYNIDSINNCLNECHLNEVKLIKKIEMLENHDYNLTEELAKMSHANDSLASIINSIREDQTNYYALPFSVLFDVDSYTIKTSERNKIKAVASIMMDDTTITYSVTGFCDNTGAQEYNQKLSEKRAEAVKNALMKYGVKEEQITISGNGFDKPFSDGMLDVNRRVSFYRNL